MTSNVTLQAKRQQSQQHVTVACPEVGSFTWNSFLFPGHFSVQAFFFNRDWTCSVEQSEQTFELFTSVPPLPLSL